MVGGAQYRLPEYPHSPEAHLKSPATIKIKGRTSHCDEEVRAGQRKAASGNDGVRTRASDRVSLSEPLAGFLALRRGLCGEGAAIVTLLKQIWE